MPAPGWKPGARRNVALRALGWGVAGALLASASGPYPIRIAAGGLAMAAVGAWEAYRHNRKIDRQP